MKRKIAVFSTGWSEEMLDAYMKGVRTGLDNKSADVYFFMCFPSLADEKEFVNGELNIFKLPDMNDFDGALVLGNAIDYPKVLTDIDTRCMEAGIPVIYTGHKMEGRYFVGIDNYYGARSLSEHLYYDHGVRDFLFIAGSEDNMDSNTRLKALKDIIEENGEILSDDRIFYSDWSPRAASMFIIQWVADGKKLPGAIICANDELAILICEDLRNNHIKVPEDVMVTGFDNLLASQVYDPSISSVSQNFDKIGCESVEMLFEIFEGKECEKERFIMCDFVKGESCGCTENSRTNDFRREIGRGLFMNSMYISAFYRKLSTIDRCLMKCRNFDDIKINFKETNDSLFKNYEGESYHIVLEPGFKEKMTDFDLSYRTNGYSEKMNVIFSLDEGNYASNDDFDSGKIVPQITDPDVNHLFICLPLHEMDDCLGYVVFADDYDKFKNSMLMGKYVESFSASLIKLQQTINARILNNKLIELSETDALTHVRNRTAYQARESSINEKIRTNECGDFALILCDVNFLKKVNDQWGHENGDIYLMNCCKLICNTFKRSAVYRFGGDEFIVILEGEDYQNAETLLDSMNAEMDRLSKQDIPDWDRISVAAGIAYYCRKTDDCVTDIFKKADEVMYNRKKEMKQMI